MGDVYVCVLESAVGKTVFSFSDDGMLTSVELASLKRIGEKGSKPKGVPSLKSLERWLKRYLKGVHEPFPGSWENPGKSPFFHKVYACVAEIPSGQWMTYGDVAKACGSPGAARAVGAAMATNPFPLVIPCHRVLGSQGLGGFTSRRGVALKRDLLTLEAKPLQS